MSLEPNYLDRNNNHNQYHEDNSNNQYDTCNEEGDEGGEGEIQNTFYTAVNDNDNDNDNVNINGESESEFSPNTFLSDISGTTNTNTNTYTNTNTGTGTNTNNNTFTNAHVNLDLVLDLDPFAFGDHQHNTNDSQGNSHSHSHSHNSAELPFVLSTTTQAATAAAATGVEEEAEAEASRSTASLIEDEAESFNLPTSSSLLSVYSSSSLLSETNSIINSNFSLKDRDKDTAKAKAKVKARASTTKTTGSGAGVGIHTLEETRGRRQTQRRRNQSQSQTSTTTTTTPGNNNNNNNNNWGKLLSANSSNSSLFSRRSWSNRSTGNQSQRSYGSNNSNGSSNYHGNNRQRPLFQQRIRRVFKRFHRRPRSRGGDDQVEEGEEQVQLELNNNDSYSYSNSNDSSTNSYPNSRLHLQEEETEEGIGFEFEESQLLGNTFSSLHTLQEGNYSSSYSTFHNSNNTTIHNNNNNNNSSNSDDDSNSNSNSNSNTSVEPEFHIQIHDRKTKTKPKPISLKRRPIFEIGHQSGETNSNENGNGNVEKVNHNLQTKEVVSNIITNILSDSDDDNYNNALSPKRTKQIATASNTEKDTATHMEAEDQGGIIYHSEEEEDLSLETEEDYDILGQDQGPPLSIDSNHGNTDDDDNNNNYNRKKITSTNIATVISKEVPSKTSPIMVNGIELAASRSSNSSPVRSSSIPSPTSPPSSSSSTKGALCCTMISKCICQNPVLKCILYIPTISDHITSSSRVLSHIFQNSKASFSGLLLFCLLFNIVLILPGYLFSLIVTEIGVYVINIFCLWCIGRFVLRLIAFPGSTVRVSNEIETEFTKYSLRMLHNASENVIEFCMLLVSMEEALLYCSGSGKGNAGPTSPRSPNSTGNNDSGSVNVLFAGSPKKKLASTLVGKSSSGTSAFAINSGHYEIVSSWKKVEQYRNRVLGMFFDVFHCLIHENGQGADLNNIVEDEKSLLTKYKNNRLVGDIGNLIPTVTKQGRKDGEELYDILKRMLADMDNLENCASELLTSSGNKSQPKVLTIEGFRAAQKLLISATELHDLIPSLSLECNAVESEMDASLMSEHRRAMLASRNSVISSIMSGVEATVSLFDPPPHKSIFGLDVLRGTMLSRYLGARQLWFSRPKSDGGGMVDVIHVPCNPKGKKEFNRKKIEKAVLFCNPNAGLIEVATGISLIGGNVTFGGSPCSWTDFYTERGYDIFLFNYSGFGRSYAGKERSLKERSRNACAIMWRIMSSSLFGFKPSPASLKADALAVATHVLKEYTIDNLIIHGESIGGMAAASTARKLSTNKCFEDAASLPKSYPTLLLCDRTFCNLPAVAAHLVGSWTSPVIPILTPFWNTDVAADFIAATCKKVIAQDAADAIIHFSSSLKKGVAIAKELKKGSTEGVGNVIETPLHYRMSDFENVGVFGSKHVEVPKQYRQVQAPTWPADKHFELREAFHFAACARRIGKVATSLKRKILFSASQDSMTYDDEEEGIEITAVFSRDISVDGQSSHGNQSTEGEETNTVILEVWETLARCDGLTGYPLGAAVKEGDDCVIDWLSCVTIFGAQRVALKAEKRIKPRSEIAVNAIDFDMGVPLRDDDDDDIHEQRLPPLPIPGVIRLLTQLYQDKVGVKDVEKELDYCIKVLEYVMSRITSTNNLKDILNVSHFRDDFDGVATGRFLNLNCGHNNQYSAEEKMQLCSILIEACDNSNSFA